MKRKNVITVAAAMAVAATMSMTVFAGELGWVHDDKGWWYGTDEAGTKWYSDGWHWLDKNGDGISECYYFGSDGYILTDTIVPDGFGLTVNGDGAWIYNGVVKEMGRVIETCNGTTLCDIAGAYLNVNLEDNVYNKYGINKTAMKMFFQSREENAEYGEISETSQYGYDHIVTYNNGFEVTYYEMNNMKASLLRVSPSRTDLDNNYLLKFYFPNHQPNRDRVADTVEKDAMLREMGFDMISNASSIFDSVWWRINDGDNTLHVRWYCDDRVLLLWDTVKK